MYAILSCRSLINIENFAINYFSDVWIINLHVFIVCFIHFMVTKPMCQPYSIHWD